MQKSKTILKFISLVMSIYTVFFYGDKLIF